MPQVGREELGMAPRGARCGQHVGGCSTHIGVLWLTSDTWPGDWCLGNMSPSAISKKVVRNRTFSLFKHCQPEI